MWLHFSQKPSTCLPVFLRESNTTIHDHSRHKYTVYELFLKYIDSEKKRRLRIACVRVFAGHKEIHSELQEERQEDAIQKAKVKLGL